MRKNLLLLLLLLLPLSAALHAQTLEAFRESLAQPVETADETRPATVTVTEWGDAQSVVDRNEQQQALRLRFRGWRICIYSDNGRDAREGAGLARTSFREAYPEIPVYESYDTPYFKVSVGDCLTREEAVVLLERVRSRFPKAFIKQEQLTVADLLH